MKKFLMFMVCLFCLSTLSRAQEVNWYKATSFSYRCVNDNDEWTNWSDWEECNLRIQFLYVKDVIIIYTTRTQSYKVIDIIAPPTDSNNKATAKYKVRNNDGDYGYIRLKVDDNGNSQVHVDMTDKSWVYNVNKLR